MESTIDDDMILPECLDITAPHLVQIQIKHDKKVIWVNVDGICRLRICRIKDLHITQE